MYAEYRDHAKRGFYEFVAGSENGVLLSPNYRRLAIPKGKGATGQANICYARDKSRRLAQATFFDEIRSAILSVQKIPALTSQDESVEAADAVVRGQGYQYDVRYQRLIERHAMSRVKTLQKKTYKTIEDRSDECSYDYSCKNGSSKEVLIEVKGTTTAGNVVLLSRTECELAERERVDLYVVKDIVIEDDGQKVKATGGAISVYKHWGRRPHAAKPLGFAVSFGRIE